MWGHSDVGDIDQLPRSSLQCEFQVGPEEAKTAIPGKGGEPWARKWELVPIPALPLDLCADFPGLSFLI